MDGGPTGQTREALLDEIFSRNFCNEEHMQAFERALAADDDTTAIADWQGEAPFTPGAPIPQHLHHDRVRKVSALSDFAPIHQRVKRRRKGSHHSGKKQEGLYQLFRWPLLTILMVFIASEFGLYVLTRQIVNAFEWLLAWRGRKGELRAKLRGAKTWEEWKEAAKVLDGYLGFDEWKREEEDPYYDYALVRKVRRSLKSLRERNDVRGVLGVLEVCVRHNFAGTESARLYSETFYGTKDSIEAYVTEVESALAYIRTSPDLTVEEKRRFFRNANRNLGSSALCFSGGAAFGFYHFGVLKAFLDADLMPRVYNGTSAGGLPAAFACTHTDEELRLMMGPRVADNITCFEESFAVTLRRLFKTGAMFNTLSWTRKSTFFTRGSLTFKEAYERTGKVLNVSVIPSDRHSPTKLLNYLTAPDCVIWSAIIASSAVPTILNPVVLMKKTPAGDVVPWNWGSKFKDGSLRVDVPVQSLNLLFNVNNPIVSQVNPHVHLFFFGARGSAGKPVAHRKGKGWRGGFLLSAAEQFLKLELTKNFKVIRDLELMPQILGQDWSSVFLQRFDGSVTIHPRTRFMDFVRMLSDPNRIEMARMQRAGSLATWPKLHIIENRFRLEREIFRGRQSVRQLFGAGRLEDKDLPAPDRDPSHPALEAGLGAPTSSDNSPVVSRGGLLPSAEGQDHLAIESDAERGYTEGSQRFFRQRSRRPSTPGRRTAHSSDEDDEDEAGTSAHPTTARDPLSSPVRRRQWASELLGSEQSREITRNRISSRAATSRQNGSTTLHRAQTEAPGSPTFLSRFRTSSFPDVLSRSVGSGSHQSTSEGSTRPRDRWRDDEDWSSNSLDDDDALLEPLMDRALGQRDAGIEVGGANRPFKIEVDPPEQDR